MPGLLIRGRFGSVKASEGLELFIHAVYDDVCKFDNRP